MLSELHIRDFSIVVFTPRSQKCIIWEICELKTPQNQSNTPQIMKKKNFKKELPCDPYSQISNAPTKQVLGNSTTTGINVWLFGNFKNVKRATQKYLIRLIG